jgi:peptide/nickel transport system permease protein
VSVSASSGIGPPSVREETDRLSLFEPGGTRRAVWERFRADRLAFASLIVLALVVLVCFAGEPVARALLGHGPNDPFLSAVDVNLNPAGPFTLVRDTRLGVPKSTAPQTLFLLGADGPLGRDEFLRLLAGGQVSLEIALGATVLAMLIGVTFGALAGYFSGLLDALVSRTTELFMAFPLLLLVIALGQTIADRFDFITLGGLLQPGVLSLSVVIGLFSWFYPARIVRSLVLQLREAEFVEAARSMGARDSYIIRRHLMPHLVGPMIVWSTLVAAGVIVFEAALSMLNLGIKLPTASWGNMLSSAWGTLLVFNPGNEGGFVYPKSGWVMAFPSVAIFVTVLCLTLVGEGLRAALRPHEA